MLPLSILSAKSKLQGHLECHYSVTTYMLLLYAVLPAILIGSCLVLLFVTRIYVLSLIIHIHVASFISTLHSFIVYFSCVFVTRIYVLFVIHIYVTRFISIFYTITLGIRGNCSCVVRIVLAGLISWQLLVLILLPLLFEFTV